GCGADSPLAAGNGGTGRAVCSSLERGTGGPSLAFAAWGFTFEGSSSGNTTTPRLVVSGSWYSSVPQELSRRDSVSSSGKRSAKLKPGTALSQRTENLLCCQLRAIPSAGTQSSGTRSSSAGPVASLPASSATKI